MSKIRLACVVGARPNFMKMAPILRALEPYTDVETTLVHTGQHYDANLSGVFFDDLDMKPPDVSLEVGSGKHGAQTARIIERFEGLLEQAEQEGKPFSRVVVVGDVNSTMACALAAVKLCIPVAHVEAGLRSLDRAMPEEINRIVTDSISDCLFVSEPAGIENLRREGHPDKHLHLVGNVMIDTLLGLLPRARELPTLGTIGLQPHAYGVVTLHRPSNVDDPHTLAGLVEALIDVSRSLPLLFAVHPRTQQRLKNADLHGKLEAADGIHLLPPLGYLEFLSVTAQAKLIVTDSGGLQEESTALGIPCLTMRDSTERPITVSEGMSTLIGNDQARLLALVQSVLAGEYKQGQCPTIWDGKAAQRIAALLCVPC